MIANTSATDLASLIVAIGTAIAAIVAAWYGAHNAGKLSTPPGAPSVGETVANVAAAVSTPPGKATLGQLVSDGVEVVNDVKEAVNGGPAKPA